EKSLIELRGVARHGGAAVRIGHQECPRYVGRAAPQLAVDEITEASTEQSDTRQRRGEVEYIADVPRTAHREDRHGHEHAEQAAMEGHATLPDLQRIERIAAPQGQSIKQHVADP